MVPVTDEEYNSYGKEKACYIRKKELGTDEDDENALNYTISSEIIVISPENLEQLHIVFVI